MNSIILRLLLLIIILLVYIYIYDPVNYLVTPMECIMHYVLWNDLRVNKVVFCSSCMFKLYYSAFGIITAVEEIINKVKHFVTGCCFPSSSHCVHQIIRS